MPADPGAEESRSVLKDCLSCRVITTAGLLLSAAYVYSSARPLRRAGHSTSPGAAFQLAVSVCLGCAAVIIFTKPVGKVQRHVPSPVHSKN